MTPLNKFQFTPLREGRRRTCGAVHRIGYFNSRPSARGDALARRDWYFLTYFNSRPSARGDKSEKVRNSKECISIHAPPRGATARLSEIVHLSERFQFTPLREGRRAVRAASKAAGEFQFTPLREGRLTRSAGMRLSSYFNSRPSARGDFGAFGGQADRAISIHAPPRGATRLPPEPMEATPAISIHAPPRGATRGRKKDQKNLEKFQFTPLREGRLPEWLPLPPAAHFNSRPSARGDAKICLERNARTFQFTPLREGRRKPLSLSSMESNFNSRPSARGDPMPTRSQWCRSISIHAPPRGATGLVSLYERGIKFQFTPLREGRLI